MATMKLWKTSNDNSRIIFRTLSNKNCNNPFNYFVYAKRKNGLVFYFDKNILECHNCEIRNILQSRTLNMIFL